MKLPTETDQPNEAVTPDEVDPSYRDFVVEATERAYSAFDKTVVALAGTGLATSLGIHGIFGYSPTPWLAATWLVWGLSLAAVLTSLWLTPIAFRKAVDQFDSGELTESGARPGGYYSLSIQTLNAVGLVLFLLGILFLALYIILA